jgi:hypothetical protein
LIKEGFNVGYSKFMDNKINDSRSVRLETFGKKLPLFGIYPNVSSGSVHAYLQQKERKMNNSTEAENTW